MRIAIIGWGSLIWYPENLYIQSKWHKDGPELPIEFARKSADKRLTLVITEGADLVKTYWALSQFHTITKAISNLKNREGCRKNCVGSIRLDDSKGNTENEIIKEWLESKSEELRAAIWTNLPPKNPYDPKKIITEDEAVSYIKSLDEEEFNKEEEYVRKTPPQINTKIRQRLRKEFDWNDNSLSPDLFEDGQ